MVEVGVGSDGSGCRWEDTGGRQSGAICRASLALDTI